MPARLRTARPRRLAVAMVAGVALGGSPPLRAAVGAEGDREQESDWAAVRALLANIKGVATTPPDHLVTTHFTDGLLMGNGDIGVAAGRPPPGPRDPFREKGLWGSSLPPPRGPPRAANSTLLPPRPAAP